MSHRQAIAIARRHERENVKLFNKMGNTKHPRGWVLTAYRQAHRALRDIIRRNALREIPEVMSILRGDLTPGTYKTLTDARRAGDWSAIGQLESYGLDSISQGNIPLASYQRQWMSTFDMQSLQAANVVISGDDPIRLIGDETRQGIVRPWPFIVQGALAIITVGALAYKSKVERTAEVTKTVFLRQAIAAIDKRTTECCLNVHGQTVGMDKPFKLTGTPRFADELMAPPFHWGACRTVQALVRPVDKADDLTERMLAAAEREEAAREEGTTIGGKTSAV